MALEITIEDTRWDGMRSAMVRACEAVLDHLDLPGERCEVSCLACDDERIAGLNAEFRGKPRPTNVLSWPADDLAPLQAGGQPARPEPDYGGDIALGDIAISYETCRREASEAGLAFADHVTHLVIHGLLHLLGYDHERDADATLMESLEVEILGKMGIDNPYKV